jgi:prepilin-type processing-associated H-X9-DG protein
MAGKYIPRPSEPISWHGGATATAYQGDVQSIMVCPSDYKMNHLSGFGYGMNSFIGGAGGFYSSGVEEYKDRKWKTLKKLTYPSTTPYILDKSLTNSVCIDGNMGGRYPSTRHSSLVNICFVDGHVANKGYETLVNQTAYWAY